MTVGQHVFITKENLVAKNSPLEIELLPGCGTKISVLYQQWLKNGYSTETFLAASDPKLAVLQSFYDIWGVGDTMAREMYNKGTAFRSFR